MSENTEALERRGGGTEMVVPRGETAATSMAAKAQAIINASYLVARAQPRDWMDVRALLLEACKRPRFAERARYAVPRGSQKARGFSIRFAEEAIRAMGNLRPEVTTVFDDDEKRIVSVALIDLERNIPWSKDVTILKRIERRQLRDGQVPLGQRITSEGHTVYIVKATDDEMLDRENALVSKAMRTHALRQVPADILEECEEQVAKTLENDAAKDPKEAAKKLADGFATLGVKPSDLKAYLGVELSAAAPAQIAHLREVFSSIRDGNLTWREVMGDAVSEEQPATLKEKVKKAAEKKAAKAKADETPAQNLCVAPDCPNPVPEANTFCNVHMPPTAASPPAAKAEPEPATEKHICMTPDCKEDGAPDPVLKDTFFCSRHGAGAGVPISIRREWAVAWPHK